MRTSDLGTRMLDHGLSRFLADNLDNQSLILARTKESLMATSTPIAFLLSRFKESTDEPMTTTAAENMFTAAGRGTMNVVDWFDDNSHGSTDMSGNAVFGWYELSDTVDNYRKKRTDGTYARDKIIELGRAAAANAGVDLSKFVAHVVVTNIEVDLFGNPTYAVCTAATAGKAVWEIQVAPSVLCQEMTHALGAVEHARHDGSDADYEDPYDVMSMFRAKYGIHPSNPNLPIGPGLNAAFMQRLGWLDATRAAPGGQVNLRPLHRRDLPGPLYSVVDKYYVEYRTSKRWDNGFSRGVEGKPSIVLVHYIANNTSYLIAELGPGDEFKWGSSSPYQSGGGSIKVDAIDDATQTATISTSHRVAIPFPLTAPASPFGEWTDAGGIVIINGKLVRIPPWSPEFRMIEAASKLVSISELGLAPALGTHARVDIYNRLLEDIEETHHHLTEPESPYDHFDKKELEAFHRKQDRKPRRKQQQKPRGKRR